MILTPENTLVLPATVSRDMPQTDRGQWFDGKNESDPDFDLNCQYAVIAETIGEQRCPTPAEWASFVITGSLVAALTDGKFIEPPSPGYSDITMERLTWEVLWQASEQNRSVLDERFLAAMLRRLVPRNRTVDGGHKMESYWESGFARSWGVWGLEYPDTSTHSIGNIRISCLRLGREAFAHLPGEVQTSIRKVASHTPSMLEIVNAHIRSRYYW